jgi:exodeoxyribonuclease VII small subunit
MTKAKKTDSDGQTVPVSYEAALQELEDLVQNMESGQMPLADLLIGYKRGAELLTYCRAQLDEVEAQIKVLDNGALKPWTPQE